MKLQMKLQMVGSYTPPKDNAMPEDCTRCHNAKWGTIVVDSVCVSCVVDELAALREAGEKMAERLRALKTWKRNCTRFPDMLKTESIFVDEDAEALEAWEDANK